jgi:SAM-dependent methyltransferase
VVKAVHNWLLYSIQDPQIKDAIETYAGGDLLDIGCGTKPYSCFTKGVVANHIGLDIDDAFNPYACPDLIGTAYDIPTEDDRFDCALSTAALEHLEDPERSLRETFRVLKPGGVAIYTVPFYYHVHAQPRDFVRYTGFGLEAAFKRAGFEVVELRPFSGFWVSMAISLSYYMIRFDCGPLRYLRIFQMLTIPVQALAWLLEKIDRPKAWTWMNLIVARKPMPDAAAAE